MTATITRLVLRERSLERSVHLDLDLGGRLLLRRAAAARDALRLGKTLPDGLGRERVQRVGLDGVHGELVVGVDRSEAARDCR